MLELDARGREHLLAHRVQGIGEHARLVDGDEPQRHAAVSRAVDHVARVHERARDVLPVGDVGLHAVEVDTAVVDGDLGRDRAGLAALTAFRERLRERDAAVAAHEVLGDFLLREAAHRREQGHGGHVGEERHRRSRAAHEARDKGGTGDEGPIEPAGRRRQAVPSQLAFVERAVLRLGNPAGNAPLLDALFSHMLVAKRIDGPFHLIDDLAVSSESRFLNPHLAHLPASWHRSPSREALFCLFCHSPAEGTRPS